MNTDQASSINRVNNLLSRNSKNSSLSNIQRLSFENIRIIRQNFEHVTSPLRKVLGENQHQSLMVAMYEGTEKLLNQDVSKFAVLEYLESLKLTAKELNQKGLSVDQFRSTLLEHSISSLNSLVHSS